MATTLSIISHGLTAVRGDDQRPACRPRFSALLAQPNLPAETSARLHRSAAKAASAREDYRAARRHLRAAARVEPYHAETRFLLGRAYESDPYGSDERAAGQYRAAARRDRTNAGYWAAYGRAAVRAGNRNEGGRSLVRAARLAPNDASVLARVIDGLLEAGRIRTAQRILTRVRFVVGRNAVFTGLWDRVRFAATCKSNRASRPARIIPFVRMADVPVGNSSGRTVRLDPPSRPRPIGLRHLKRKVRR